MFENLLSIESLLAISVGALFSFRVSKVSLSLKNNIRNQSPDIHGSNNVVIYNQAMVDVGKEMAFSVKVCAVVMMIMFHMFPAFFVNLLISLSFFLPVFSLIGVINAIRLNGSRRGWDILYILASVVMGVIFYCSARIMFNYLSLYPQLTQLYDYLSEFGLVGALSAKPQIYYFQLVLTSSLACPALIVLGFYLAFAYTKARDGNNAFRYSAGFLASGYMSYILLSGSLFLPSQGRHDYFVQVFTYPFNTLISLFSL
ncbi:hypothetical protein [Yersinia pseudotuberculosis]|uniref:Uncharacterized protein n=1 Tax=Yersinia pseudotuberculosis TaxID=633 RepID=A0A380Q4L3_YERPU|nr:hypothetical protein [Yersinia pseudotuberculosis]CND69640.1 Uncharacterised protein [Yersinia pseudotuberculosis]SUP80499.1 Uncharacterised protein [Yersinia pseudotuberculosis]